MLNNNYKKQVNKELYFDKNYITFGRISTYCLLIKNVFKLKERPVNILEIGPGNKILTNFLINCGFFVETLDFDEKINPDYVMDVNSSNFEKVNKKYDLVIASQVFEHIRFEDFIKALEKLKTKTNKLFITLPHYSKNSISFFFAFKIPFIKYFFISKKFNFFKKHYLFNKQHYWEIGTKDTSLKKIKKEIKKTGWKIKENYINENYSYHHFFYLEN
ncbi:MAG: methyltransferase domain-containing protein [Patescibacteria group bacterium]